VTTWRFKVVQASVTPFIDSAEVTVERLALGLVEACHEVLMILGTQGLVLEQMRSVGLRCL
jgi:hypothetical protein